MTDDMHPDVAAVLKQAQRLQSIVDDQLHKMSNEPFTATDESETVEVTLNGHHYLTAAFIADGLLRLGARTVQQRITEAPPNGRRPQHSQSKPTGSGSMPRSPRSPPGCAASVMTRRSRGIGLR